MIIILTSFPFLHPTLLLCCAEGDRPFVCVPQEMAVRALKQTGSRNIEAALEYISKMGYLDPRNELIVRVIKQTSPGNFKKSCMA